MTMANQYAATFKGRTIQVGADTSYAAQQKAASVLKVRPKQRYLISVMLLERDGEAVSHSTASI